MSVTLHTTLGDLKIEIFCESVPKTAEVRRQPRQLSELERNREALRADCLTVT
jgi:hypothetical protein